MPAKEIAELKEKVETLRVQLKAKSEREQRLENILRIVEQKAKTAYKSDLAAQMKSKLNNPQAWKEHSKHTETLSFIYEECAGILKPE